MKIGDYFPLAGYDIMATAENDLGDVHVLSNNSSHMLVASVDNESMTDGLTTGNARLEASFPYDDRAELNGSDLWQEAYRKALEKMVEITLRRI